ncbi:MAG TPA: hypothetical protein VGD17_14705 [Chitinophagaceae bacterium]
MVVSEIQLYNSLRERFGDAKAQELVDFIKFKVDEEFMECKQTFLVKEDKIDLVRSIFLAGVIQYLAIISSVLAIIAFKG